MARTSQRSVMKHQFSQVPKANIPRSSFDRSHGYKTCFDSGYLVPIFVDEAYPGDTFNVQMSALARMATPLYPLMDNLFLDTFFFAIPIRLLWENWEKFNGEQENPEDSTDYLVPQMSAPENGYDIGSISDYFGIPTGIEGLTHSVFWHRAYNLVIRDWFRDQNLQTSPVINKDDGPDLPEDYPLVRRGKRHDYFTSCLPWPQKGPAVDVPLGDRAPVLGIGPSQDDFEISANIRQSDGSLSGNVSAMQTGENQANSKWLYTAENPDIPGYPGIYADLQEATAVTINTLRNGFQVQKMLERDARGGTRYVEIIKSHFNVTSPDFRLQRPEYLGGGSTPVVMNPVASTVDDDAGQTKQPQGSLAAFATAHVNRNGFVKSFTEHCVIIGLANIRADLTYQQGLDRMFSRRTRFDFYWPALSHLGEQAVLSKEIFADGTEDDELVWGYQERFGELKYKPSRITNYFRSTSAIPLDAWHLSQEFDNRPTLSDDFIQDNPPVDRVIATQDEPQFIFDSYFKMRCARPMPLYSVPGLIDHF